jgi:hypothetical protein
MQNPKIRVDVNKIKDLLDEEHYQIVLKQHIHYRAQRLSAFFQKALEKNADEWSMMPKTNSDGCYQIEFSNDINTILGQEVSAHLIVRVSFQDFDAGFFPGFSHKLSKRRSVFKSHCELAVGTVRYIDSQIQGFG